MAQPLAQTHQDQLQRIKQNVKESREFFQSNYDRFNEFRRFVFQSTLTDDDIDNLKELGKPILEFNILKPYISRLCGEFSKQEPKIEVHASHDTPVPVDAQTVQVVDGLFRVILDTAQKEGQTLEVFKDLMSGGFSVFEVFPEYGPGITFDYIFKVKRVFSPTLTGFDPLAQESHKGDGRYAYCLYPRSEEQFKAEYQDVDLSKLSFTRSNANFNWSFRNQQQTKILLLCDYYEKKEKPEKIVRLADNKVMTVKQYKKFLEMWEERSIIAVPPKVVAERTAMFPTVHQYKFIENQMLEHKETDYTFLPYVFVDGDSIRLESQAGGDTEQMTIPYLYPARDIQRLKNFAGQTLANELENMIQHKFKVAEESIPAKYEDVYSNIQQADTLVYKAFKDNDPNQPLPPPQEIVRTPIPPEVTNTFNSSDQTAQSILGSFDMQAGNLNVSQLSGLAIQESITQSNAVAMPYVNGYLNALNQVANNIVDLIPKYYTTPRTVPVLNAEGKRSYVRINDDKQPSVPLDYYDNALHVTIEAGVNFTIQKARALQQIIAMMQASPSFAQFMNAQGLPILLDNLEIRGIDQLKLLAEQYVQQMKQQQPPPNPEILKIQNEQQKIAMTNQQNQAANQLDAMKLAIAQQEANTEQTKVLGELNLSQQDQTVQNKKANVEAFKQMTDLTLAHHDQQHRHVKETVELGHQILTSLQPEQPTQANANG